MVVLPRVRILTSISSRTTFRCEEILLFSTLTTESAGCCVKGSQPSSSNVNKSFVTKENANVERKQKKIENKKNHDLSPLHSTLQS
jgi:hypothetical protein